MRVPVVAAGGIADARGIAAAFALGAAGVQIGTAYLFCPEARTSAIGALTPLKVAAEAKAVGFHPALVGAGSRFVCSNARRGVDPKTR